MKKLLAIFLAFMAVSFATDISSCQELSSPDTYVLTANIYGNESPCFDITGDNIVLDCQGNTITWVSGSGNIEINAENATVKDCVLSGQPYGILIYEIGANITNNTLLTMHLGGIEDMTAGYANINNNIINLHTGAYGIVLSGSGNIVQSNKINGDGTGIYTIAGIGTNTIYLNDFNTTIWVFDNRSNTYAYNAYFVSGEPAYQTYIYLDTNGDGYADTGANYPINAANEPDKWTGFGADSFPKALLFDINLSRLVQIYVFDNVFNPQINKTVKIEQVSVMNSSDRMLVGTITTDNFGSGTYLLLPSVYLYHFSVYYQNGTLQEDYANIVIPCYSNEALCKIHLQITSYQEIGYIASYGGSSGVCNWDNSTGYLNCTSIGANITATELNVYFSNASIMQKVCTDTTAGAGMVECTDLNSTVETCYNIVMNATYANNEHRTLVSGRACTREQASMGVVGMLSTLFLVCAFTGMGVYFGVPGAFVGMASGLSIALLIGFIPGVMFPVVIVLDIVLGGFAAYMVKGA